MSFDTTQLLELKSRSFEAVKKEIEELIELIINDDPDGYLGNTYLKLVHEDKDGIPTGANILFLDGKDLGSMIFIIKDGREVQFNKLFIFMYRGIVLYIGSMSHNISFTT